MKIDVRIKKLHTDAIIPSYATAYSAGVDLCAIVEGSQTIKKGEIAIIPTGIAIALPIGHEAQIRPRSGLAAKSGITVLNTPGTIDADYRGEIKIILINHGAADFVIENKMRIAQMIIAKHDTANFIENNFDEAETERGSGGFGSTGVK